LIIPNPESSLNEEAGRLMQEHYDDYFAKAKLFTSIHAMGHATKDTKTESKTESKTEDESDTKENKSNNSTPATSTVQKAPSQTIKKKANSTKRTGAKRL
jgi:ubiquitin-conjugating enzyme E2 S